MIAQTDQKIHTVEEYFDLELTSENRHEYYNGDIILMTGGTPNHNEIAGNFYILLKSALKGQNYRTFVLDQRLWIPDCNIYTYPDIMVNPIPLELQTGRKDTVVNPYLIAEVLSKSTRNYDRGEKFNAYRSLPNFKEYILIDQYRVHIDHYVKKNVNQWLLTEYKDLNDTLSFNTFEFQVQIAEIYETIEFSETE